MVSLGWVIVLFGNCLSATAVSSDDESAKLYVDTIEVEYQTYVYNSTVANFAYATDLNMLNKKRLLDAQLQMAKFENEFAKNVSLRFNISQLQDPSTKRKMQFIALKYFPLDDRELTAYGTAIADMKARYSSFKVCHIDDQAHCERKWSLDPDLIRILATSKNSTVLQYAWEQWHAIGRQMRTDFQAYVQLGNKGVRAAGLFENKAEDWIYEYEMDGFDLMTTLEALWRDILPLYEQLHAYVLRRLKLLYSESFAENQHTIPVHLLGNMWAQDWTNLYSVLQPYPHEATIDITFELRKQGYSVRRMFKTAERFFTSLGMDELPQTFWNLSMLTKPTDREAVCHASAWDFRNRRDVAIKMCTQIDHDSFDTIHHELGHIYYYLAYMNQSLFFQRGANAAFHEAVGDTVFLSVMNPTYLRKVHLLPDYQETDQSEMNRLFLNALNFLPFLPYAYSLDLWRYRVFKGNITAEEYNPVYWDLRKQYQGISPSSLRSRDDFDPGAKYHVVTNSEYLRYFMSKFLVFQFHESLCKSTNELNSLARCSIFGNKNAGRKFQKMLSLGSSVPWRKVLETLTGNQNLQSAPLLEYFQPLYNWLQEENQNASACFGWGHEWPLSYNHLPQPRCVQHV